MADVRHPLTVTTSEEGRDYDWTHPTDCPDGEHCDILRRTHRNRSEDLVQLAEGRPDGTYLLGRFGFHGLLLIDEHGAPLPDVAEAADESDATRLARVEQLVENARDKGNAFIDTDLLIDALGLSTA